MSNGQLTQRLMILSYARTNSKTAGLWCLKITISVSIIRSTSNELPVLKGVLFGGPSIVFWSYREACSSNNLIMNYQLLYGSKGRITNISLGVQRTNQYNIEDFTYTTIQDKVVKYCHCPVSSSILKPIAVDDHNNPVNLRYPAVLVIYMLQIKEFAVEVVMGSAFGQACWNQ